MEKQRMKVTFDFNGTKEELEKFLDKTLRADKKIHDFSLREAYSFEGVEFKDFIKDFIENEMYELSDDDEFYNTESLIDLLHEEDFMNNTPFCRSVDEDEAFVNEYPDVAEDVLNKFGGDIHKLQYECPGQFANYMIQLGMEEILISLPAMQELDSQNLDGENKKVLLNEENLNLIVDQMQEKNLDKTFEIFEVVKDDEEEM